MTPDEFATSMEDVAAQEGHPMDEGAKGLLRRMIERCRADWAAGKQEAVMSRVRLAIVRAVMYARAFSKGTDKPRVPLNSRWLTIAFSETDVHGACGSTRFPPGAPDDRGGPPAPSA